MKKYLLLLSFVAFIVSISISSFAATYTYSFYNFEDDASCLDSITAEATKSSSAHLTITGYKACPTYPIDFPAIYDAIATLTISGYPQTYGRDSSPAYFVDFNELQCLKIVSDVPIFISDYSFVACCTLVTLASFDVKPGNEKAMITWKTESETDNAGFNIYRAESKNGDYKMINEALIPAEGSTQEGATYTYTDEGLQNRKAYFYKLEDIDTEGTAFLHEPVRVVPRMLYQYME